MAFFWLLATGCGSVLDEPAADLPVRPAPRAAASVALARELAPSALELPPSSRPEPGPAPETFPLVAPFQFSATRKNGDVWKTPLPVNADLLPTPLRGTHSFGSAPPPDIHVTGPGGEELRFERMGRMAGSWGFDRDWLYVGVEKGETPDAADYAVTFARAARTEDSLNLATSGEAPQDFVRATFTAGGVSHHGLYLPAPATARFQLTVPERGRLAFEGTVLAPAIGSAIRSDGATVVVEVDGTEVGRVPVARDAFAPGRIDLSAWAGRAVELTIRTEPGDEPTLDYVLLEGATVYTPSDDPRRILLVFVDTLRRDRLGFYGYEEHAVSPHLDRWSANAAVFEQARTVAPWTLPSALAVLSGRQPEDWHTAEPLPETLAAAGWRTEAIVANAFLSQPFDVHRGWDRYRYEHLLPPGEIVGHALDALAASEDRDLLLMVHFMGPHLPYDEPWTYRWRWAGREPAELERVSWPQLVKVTRDTEGFDAIREHVSDRYDQNVRWVDDSVAPLIEAMGRDATVVLFSDHGEELWEHDGFEHGHAFWDELLRVPLAIKSPALPPGRLEAPVSLLDVTPTLREIAGLPPGDGPGRSLVPLAWGDAGSAEALAARPQAFGRPLYGQDGWGVVADGHKWIDRSGEQHLFDLGADPLEEQDVAPGADLAPFPAAMGEALGREAKRVWRVSLRTQEWPHPLELTITHPGGIAAAWAGYDPRGRSAATRPELVDGRVRMRIAPKEEAPEVLYVLPSGDALDPRGLAVTLVGRSVMVGATCDQGPIEPSAATPPFVRVDDGRFGVEVDLAWVPEPGGVEVSGFHPDMARQLQELGYLGD